MKDRFRMNLIYPRKPKHPLLPTKAGYVEWKSHRYIQCLIYNDSKNKNKKGRQRSRKAIFRFSFTTTNKIISIVKELQTICNSKKGETSLLLYINHDHPKIEQIAKILLGI